MFKQTAFHTAPPPPLQFLQQTLIVEENEFSQFYEA